MYCTYSLSLKYNILVYLNENENNNVMIPVSATNLEDNIKQKRINLE